jgi:hypothetical protein
VFRAPESPVQQKETFIRRESKQLDRAMAHLESLRARSVHIEPMTKAAFGRRIEELEGKLRILRGQLDRLSSDSSESRKLLHEQFTRSTARLSDEVEALDRGIDL